MHFMMDKKEVLYMSIPGELHATTLDDLIVSNDAMSINAIDGVSGSCDVLSFGPNTRTG